MRRAWVVALLALVMFAVPAAAQTMPDTTYMRVLADSIADGQVRQRAFNRSAETTGTRVVDQQTRFNALVRQLIAYRAGTVTPPPAPAPAPLPPPPVTTSGAFFSDDFDGYPVGSQVAGQGSNGFRWGIPHDGVTVSRDFALTGSQSLKFEYGSATVPHWWAEQTFHLGRDVKQLALEYWLYFPAGFLMPDGTAQNNKFLSLWGDSYQSEPLTIFQLWTVGDRNLARLDVGRTLGNLDGDADLIRYPRSPEGPLRGGNFLSSASDRGRWIRVRVHVQLADLGQSNGRIRMWKDDVLMIDIQNDPLYDEARVNNFIRNGYLWGYDNARFAQPVAVYLDGFRAYDALPAGW